MNYKLVERIMLLLNPKIRDKILLLRLLKKPVKCYGELMNIDKMANDIIGNNWGELDKDINVWRKAFKLLSISTSVGYEIANYFFKDDLKIVNSSRINNFNRNDVIAICVVKNDLIRMKTFYEHYRKLGVKRFAILDNNSDDGTYEWLKEQKDTDLFKTDIPYSTLRRQAWINKIIAYYGFNRWYLIVDSDELFVYENCENNKINDLINIVQINRITRVRTLTVDMYSDGSKGINESDYLKHYVYFDSDNYELIQRYNFNLVVGGMRARVFQDNNKRFFPYLTKYPLIYFEKGDIQYSSHYSFPFYKNFQSPCWGALLHYKFLPSDLKRYSEISKSGKFHNNSYEYKQYIKKYREDSKLSFIYKDSKEYKNSYSLRYISIIENIKW
ncbi:glycosyltransferase family 2 protein [Defluviitalea raffinosedens]|uniref:glycosyltransferase family 2 protein n=1 Tax=Defluviitalea raffinosedens TaxID=1450156 RepID=UPI00195871EF|nr:glycosyltransferase family 2 protein [Defluviitalea raffinosedens]MBM7685773.1 hypothetical protein [Defluviitalea raffinosedens]